LLRQRGQRIIGQVEQIGKVGLLGIDVEDAGQNLVAVVGLHQRLYGGDAVGRVVAVVQLAQPQVRAVVHGHVVGGTRVVIDGDVLEEGHESGFGNGLFVLLHILVALGGAFVVVEGAA